MKKIRIVISALVLCLCVNVAAQTPAETKAYTKVMAKPKVKALTKFLSKYPESVYSLEIETLRDSILFASVDKDDAAAVRDFASSHPDSPLKEIIYEHIRRHNTSGVSRSEAGTVAGTEAVGWKVDDVDYVVGISLSADGTIMLATYNMDGSKACDDRRIPKHELGSSVSTRLVDSLSVVEFNYRNMLTFSYINENTEGEQEYVSVLYDYLNDYAHSAMFYGTSLLEKSSDGSYKIEGQCLESVSGGIITAEQMWAINSLGRNPSLVQLTRADLLTGESIKWWTSRNGKAVTSKAPARLNFGVLDPESSLVKAYAKAPKEKGDKYNAALFNLRGYTVIVSYSKSSGEYLLVWCEPECRNRKTDRLLNSIYFEGSGSSLAMFYYHGRKTYKYRVNLADKTLRK